MLYLGQKRGDRLSLHVSSVSRARPSSPNCAGAMREPAGPQHPHFPSLHSSLPTPGHLASLCFLSKLNGIGNRVGEVTPETQHEKAELRLSLMESSFCSKSLFRTLKTNTILYADHISIKLEKVKTELNLWFVQ